MLLPPLLLRDDHAKPLHFSLQRCVLLLHTTLRPLHLGAQSLPCAVCAGLTTTAVRRYGDGRVAAAQHAGSVESLLCLAAVCAERERFSQSVRLVAIARARCAGAGARAACGAAMAAPAPTSVAPLV